MVRDWLVSPALPTFSGSVGVAAVEHLAETLKEREDVDGDGAGEYFDKHSKSKTPALVVLGGNKQVRTIVEARTERSHRYIYICTYTHTLTQRQSLPMRERRVRHTHLGPCCLLSTPLRLFPPSSPPVLVLRSV